MGTDTKQRVVRTALEHRRQNESYNRGAGRSLQEPTTLDPRVKDLRPQ
jgi:hypothetical protein